MNQNKPSALSAVNLCKGYKGKRVVRDVPLTSMRVKWWGS
jgi:hypothetical protein